MSEFLFYLFNRAFNLIVECFPNLYELRFSVCEMLGSMLLKDIINFIRSRLMKLEYLYYIGRSGSCKPGTKFKAGARLKLSHSNHLIVYSSDELLETLEIFDYEQYNIEARRDCILCNDLYFLRFKKKTNWLIIWRIQLTNIILKLNLF